MTVVRGQESTESRIQAERCRLVMEEFYVSIPDNPTEPPPEAEASESLVRVVPFQSPLPAVRR
jgi:hypothetical protein